MLATAEEMTGRMFPTSPLAPVRVGKYVLEDGSVAEFSLPMPGDGGRHWLVGGTTGAGKTYFLRTMLCEVAPRPHVAVLLQDPKRNEFSRFGPRATCVAKRVESAVTFLDRLMFEMDARFDHMDREGLSLLDPSAEWPYLLPVFDEFAALGRNGTSRDVSARHGKVEEIAQMGRSAGIGLTICTQRPSADAVPMAVRDQMRIRVAFGCESWQQSGMILGDGTGKRADLISEATPGRAYVKVDRSVHEIRSYAVGDAEFSAVAERHSALRVDLPGWPRVIDPGKKES